MSFKYDVPIWRRETYEKYEEKNFHKWNFLGRGIHRLTRHNYGYVTTWIDPNDNVDPDRCVYSQACVRRDGTIASKKIYKSSTQNYPCDTIYRAFVENGRLKGISADGWQLP